MCFRYLRTITVLLQPDQSDSANPYLYKTPPDARPDSIREHGCRHVLFVMIVVLHRLTPRWEDQEINITVEIKVSRCERADKIGAEKVTSQCILNASDESL